MKYDFVVIGSGITGAFFADLASNYASVLVIDKMHRPRSEFRGGVFPAHNYSYFQEKDAPIPLDDKKIFSSDQYELLYSGREHDGMIDGHEFGGPFGKICELDKLNLFFIERAEKKGAQFIFESEVSSVSVKEGHVSVEIDERHSKSALKRTIYNADVLILATGAQIALSKEDILKNDPENLVLKAFNLQRSLGFSLPEIYFAAALKYKGSPEVIDENIPFQYRYHYNRKISPYGPLYCVKHKDYFDIGIIHKTPFNAIDRLIAVVKRYKKVRGFFKNTKPISYNFSIDISSLKLEESKKEEFPIVIIPTTKHAIKETTKDRVIVLGEAAGLVTDLFYEGVVGALASARFASDVLKDLKSQADLSKEKNISSYKNSPNALRKYDQVLRRKLINTYLKSQHGSEILFLNSGDAGEIIFDTYAKLLSKEANLRKYVYDSLILDDLEKYNFSNDKKTGEAIYKSLSFSQKMLYLSHFLRAWQ